MTEGGGPEPGRPRSDWSVRAEQAKQDGSWYADREQCLPLTGRERARRFFLWATPVFLLSVVAHFVLALLRHRSGVWTGGELISAVIGGFFPAVLLGSFAAWPTRRRPLRPRRRRGR